MREVKYTARFKRDYRREKSGRHSKKLDALLMEVVNLLADDTPLPRRAALLRGFSSSEVKM
jgi:mRNA interferase YafQ